MTSWCDEEDVGTIEGITMCLMEKNPNFNELQEVINYNPGREDIASYISDYAMLKMSNLGGYFPAYAANQITNLMVISSRGYYPLLLDRSSELSAPIINMQDVNGMTAMHYAIQSERTSLFETLISFGGNPALKNNQGQSLEEHVPKQIVRELQQFDSHPQIPKAPFLSRPTSTFASPISSPPFTPSTSPLSSPRSQKPPTFSPRSQNVTFSIPPAVVNSPTIKSVNPITVVNPGLQSAATQFQPVVQVDYVKKEYPTVIYGSDELKHRILRSVYPSLEMHKEILSRDISEVMGVKGVSPLGLYSFGRRAKYPDYAVRDGKRAITLEAVADQEPWRFLERIVNGKYKYGVLDPKRYEGEYNKHGFTWFYFAFVNMDSPYVKNSLELTPENFESLAFSAYDRYQLCVSSFSTKGRYEYAYDSEKKNDIQNQELKRWGWSKKAIMKAINSLDVYKTGKNYDTDYTFNDLNDEIYGLMIPRDDIKTGISHPLTFEIDEVVNRMHGLDGSFPYPKVYYETIYRSLIHPITRIPQNVLCSNSNILSLETMYYISTHDFGIPANRITKIPYELLLDKLEKELPPQYHHLLSQILSYTDIRKMICDLLHQ